MDSTLLGIQDHPYVSRFFDTMSLIPVLLAETRRLRIFPNVASLPLRPPALLAKSAASLDILSGGRFELGIGSGASWEGIAAMGGQRAGWHGKPLNQNGLDRTEGQKL